MNFDVIYTVLTFDNILWIAFGVLLGYVVGVIPGLERHSSSCFNSNYFLSITINWNSIFDWYSKR